MARARQERAEITRQAILDGAARAFDTAGFGITSLSDIAQEAGVTKGALYFHFSSKEALARALMADQFDVASVIEAADRPGVQTAVDLTHRMAYDLRTSVRVRAGVRLVIELGSFTDPNPSVYNKWIETVRDCLAPAQGRGDIKPEVNVADIAIHVVGAFAGVQIMSQVRTGREDLHRRVADMWSFLLPGIVPSRRLSRFDPTGSPGLRASLSLPSADQETVAVG
ncbi:ScbR family autoregulator-binding transcription factor [Streptomyces sp. TRM 70361]|uniref:ScbR family autoregulator-binding transcription factor n=1 Tax=Streptomyces sp. TRM 70361 TaxID=3116553 RepID=UPI002E7BD4FD|nr:ScbR family autoregulator-binding transcription factor [Streptomyces sp. TRM 70361]MEE1941973.1 ScbR family autoregulator-binding transcription factor [Streptomyces sp. TRM 70361]